MKNHSHWLFIALVVVVLLTAFALLQWFQSRHTPLPVLVGNEHRIQDFSLVDQNGDTVTLKDWNNKIVVANFFFTHCPAVCPKIVRNLKNVQDVYRDDPQLSLASFTVDPERDSVDRLRSFAGRMNIQGAWQLLTGNKKDIYRLARNSFLATATDGDGGPGDFIHSETLVLVDKQKRIRGFYNGTSQSDANLLIRDIARLKKEE